MDASALDLLKRLSESFGPSGFEREPVSIVKAWVQPFADELGSDKLGSLHFTARGSAKEPVVVLPGHVDEVGFIVSGVHTSGYLTFNALGGWYDQVLLGQRVRIRTPRGMVSGVIAAKPPHILSAEERAKVLTRDKMFIDIGCSNQREAKEMGVRIGDPVVPDSSFSIMEKTAFKKPQGGGVEQPSGTARIACGKAFDDRVGALVAALVVRALKEQKISHPNTVVGMATVQEEVGLRGARTSANVVRPDVCLTLEVDIAGDVPGIEPHEAPTRMGEGPGILTVDGSMIPNTELKELVIRTAEDAKIPYQLSLMKSGGTDAGAMHMANAGCPSVVITVPTRHIHSHVALVSLDDIDNAVALLLEVVKRLDKKTVESLTAI
ncbi:MAG TPA: M42 family metallopeptidase [bacterium]|nr:M42 family metallopeptidase [bacterium]